ncbi:2,3-bisphosphoglycerate-dependent phosphoglycerate mutase [Tribonema minus]|uniref:phosphoglycerate mutase (2,3-diphosphoglycerate-dependent) n=1 Tax=Tribonema minus TaxID=303371 RepID=A0A835YKM6_9STRA|nr:2,3-bisphosphoglycerate-dependent phosphoglycerate mutase [Tribonema minus]
MHHQSTLCARPVLSLRHGESTYNAEGRFIGWADPPLTERGEEEARRAAHALREHGFADAIDDIFVSYLRRSIKSGWIIADELGCSHVPVNSDWRLNEQMYGMLQGRLKRDVAHEHGVDLTQKWRRSYDIAPPAVAGARGYFPAGDAKYAELTDDDAPESWCGSAQTESLKDTQARAWRLWKERIAPRARAGRTSLVVGHGNVIRAMLKRLDGIGNERLREVCIPRAVPLVYELDAEMRPVRSAYAFGALSGYFLANPKQIAAALKIESTEAQLGLRAGADPGETSSSSGSFAAS